MMLPTDGVARHVGSSAWQNFSADEETLAITPVTAKPHNDNFAMMDMKTDSVVTQVNKRVRKDYSTGSRHL